jgi:transcriptional regulator with XRE-family HTH domain
VTAADPWKRQVEAFGEFIKSQRKLANLSLRDLSAVADVSNAYLSQLERGLHTPSIRVLNSLAEAFNVSAETMLEQAGLVRDAAMGERAGPETEAAIKADPRLSESQKAALLGVYRGFTGE